MIAGIAPHLKFDEYKKKHPYICSARKDDMNKEENATLQGY